METGKISKGEKRTYPVTGFCSKMNSFPTKFNNNLYYLMDEFVLFNGHSAASRLS